MEDTRVAEETNHEQIESEEKKEKETLLPSTNQESCVKKSESSRRFHLYLSVFICKFLPPCELLISQNQQSTFYHTFLYNVFKYY